MTTSEAAAGGHTPARGRGHATTLAAGSIGNALEWYDFAVYGYLAQTIGRQFFPAASPTGSLLSAFAVFAVGYLMRPVGGVVIGHIGDRYGRRLALLVSIAGMAVPTVLIGLLPGYAVIGIWAPILLILLRMLQGMSVGGEYVGSVVFLVESAPPGRRGLYGAFARGGVVAGVLMGSAAAAGLAAVVPADVVDAWAWRLPFLCGIVVAGPGFLLRRRLEEPQGAARTVARAPVAEAVRDHPRAIAKIIALSMFNAVGFNLSFVYVASWLQVEAGLTQARALEINTLCMAILLVVQIAFGAASDRIGRRPIFAGATLAAVVLAWPVFWLMRHGGAGPAFLGQLVLVVLVGAYGAEPAALVETVAARVRVSAVAIGYNLSLGIIGGCSPLIATWLIAQSGDPLAPAFFVMTAAAISFVATRGMAETARRPLPV